MGTISADRLAESATGILVAGGVPADHARLVADSLVRADLWGHQSHGVLRLPWYVARLGSGAMAARTEPETVVDAGGVAALDGHDGIGQVLAAHAAPPGGGAGRPARAGCGGDALGVRVELRGA